MARGAVGILVQLAGLALGLSVTFLYGEKVCMALAVELIGCLLPLCALLSSAGGDKSFSRRVLLLVASGAWLGNRLAIVMPLAMLPVGFAPAWASPLLMGAAFVVAGVSSRGASEIQPPQEPELIDLKWESVLDKLPGYESLSRREREVLELTLEGKTGKEIGEVLHIAPSTAGSYRSRIYEKLGVSSVQDVLSAVAHAMTAGLEEHKEGDGHREKRVGVPYLYGLLILLLCVAVSMTAQAIYQPYLSCFVVLVAGVLLCICAWRMRSGPLDLTQLFVGLSAGFAGCAILYSSWNLAAVLAPLLLIAAFSIVGECSWGLAAASALAASLFIPGDGLVGGLATVPLAMLLISALLWTIALLSESAKTQRLAADSANLVAEGERRVMAYLEGRGLSELKAKVCLLTAYGFDAQTIADALFVSASTVSNYRSKSYESLGVYGREGLTSLLKHDAGFSGLLSERGRNES